MSIRFKITNPIAGADAIKVYRSTAPISSSALPTALATLAVTATEYADDTAVRNTLYYYRVEVSKGGESVLSPNKPLMYLPDTGPGPSKIIRGDYELGYFGRFAIDDLIGPAEFKSYFALDWTVPTGANLATQWLKFIVKGKILYFPDSGFFTGATFETAYKAGLVYGSNAAGVIPDAVKSNYGTVDQTRRLTYKNYQFQPRCPVSRAIPNDETATAALYMGGEIDAIFALAQLSTLYSPAVARFDDIVNNSNTTYYLTQSTITPKNAVARRPDNGAVLSTGQTTSITYKPVLELVL